MRVQLKSLAVPVAVAAFLFTNVATAQQKTPPPPPGKVIAPKPPAPPAINDFDDARKELDRASAELEKTMRNLPEPPKPPRIDEAGIEKAIKEAEGQLAKIDKAAINKPIEQAHKDMELARKEMEVARKEMETAKVHQQQAMKQIEEEMTTIRPKIEAQMKEARENIEKARKELEAYDNFVSSLAADGLINKSAYTIEHRNGKLIIDGKEQPEAVYNKHRAFLQNNTGIRISKNEKGLNIHKD